MEEKTIFDSIRNWADKRGIYKGGDTKTQYLKLNEESGELARALLNDDVNEAVDAIGDMVVVLVNLAELLNLEANTRGGFDHGISIETCIDNAWNEIKNRQGKMINGTFVKDK